MKTSDQRVDVRHEDSHHPAAADGPLFQESWAFAWVDPVSRLAGWHHFGLQRNRGVADINSYLALDGQVVGRHEDLEHPMPEGDFPNLSFPTIRIAAVERLKTHAISISHGDARVDLTMNAFVGPLDWKHQEAPSHWESFGTVTGQAEVRGRTFPVSGMAFQDRSWGSRDLRDMAACRVITAIFGDDLVVRIFEVKNQGKSVQYGYVHDGDRQFAIQRADINLGMANDSLNLADLQATAWTQGGRGYALSGTCIDNEIGLNRDERVSIQGNFVFRHGGRVGTGFVVDLRKLTEEHAAACAARDVAQPMRPPRAYA